MCAIMRVVVVLPLVPVTATIGMRAEPPSREEHVDDGPADAARMPLGGVGVHAEAGPGVDLDDPAAGLAHGAGDVGGDQVDPGHVEPDDHRRLPRDLGVVRVDLVGAVDRGAAGAHVAGLLQLDVLARAGNGVELECLAGPGSRSSAR